MKSVVVVVVVGLALCGCGQKETAPPLKASSPTAAPMPSLGSAPVPTPAPNAGAPAAAVPSVSAASAIPVFEGKDEAERLTMALRAYYDDPNRPAITSFEPLVKARLIASIPVPPAGKKYVIDLKRGEVRLENQ